MFTENTASDAHRLVVFTFSFARIALLAMLSGGIITSPSLLTANDWPRWRGTDFNGISKETGWSTSWPQEGPKQLWKANVGTGFSSIAISHGRAYTLGNINDTETIYCFDANTGNVLWKHSYACSTDPNLYEGGPNATPTVAGETVYTFSRKGHVFALDAGSGNVIWSKNIHDELGLKIPSWGFSGSPLAEGKLLIINAGPAGTALDKATGKVVWSSGKESAGYSSPLPFSNGPTRAALLFSTKALSAVDPENGQLLWEHPWKTPWGVNAADPVIVGDKIFISSGYNQGCALLRVVGNKVSVLWRNENMRNHFNSSLAVGDSVDASGLPRYQIGTTDATNFNLEECSGCGIQGWGWEDNGWGVGVTGPLVYFATTGTHTIRIQVREDGLAIDQILLSPDKYKLQSPGFSKNDTTILQ